MERINVAELLRNCPKGMELDCSMFEGVFLERVDKNVEYPIAIRVGKTDVKHLTKEGCWNKYSNAKCVIFPKGKTTWEGFHRPFKDGDIIYIYSAYPWICIYKEGGEKENVYYKYVAITSSSFGYGCSPLCHRDNVEEIRHATEEEKKKLFAVIRENGYKWNTETKTLEKLIEPKFKVGDKITFRCEEDKPIISITGVKGNYYLVQYFNIIKGDYQNEKISFEFQDNYELVPDKLDVTTLKPFDKVLTRVTTGDVWGTDFFGYYKNGLFHCNGRTAFSYCIPYQGNEHLLGTTDDCDEHFKTWK